MIPATHRAGRSSCHFRAQLPAAVCTLQRRDRSGADCAASVEECSVPGNPRVDRARGHAPNLDLSSGRW